MSVIGDRALTQHANAFVSNSVYSTLSANMDMDKWSINRVYSTKNTVPVQFVQQSTTIKNIIPQFG